jgi:ATP adenylyltransferase
LAGITLGPHWPGFDPVPAESFWQQALERSLHARARGDLVPLLTEPLALGLDPFVIRRLLSRTPKHLRAAGPRPNPFLPWEPGLEVARLQTGHVLLLNKFPVQPGHLLVITPHWAPQAGWLTLEDLQAVVDVSADTSGLWFFNSCAAAGASQPHRHLQLLPRHDGELCCPLEPQLLTALGNSKTVDGFAWAHALSRRQDPTSAAELHRLVLDHATDLGLGKPGDDVCPRHPYNLLFSNDWLMTVRRSREHWHGFSINGLGFAGYLLATAGSDLEQLRQQGPWQLLRAVAVDPDLR